MTPNAKVSKRNREDENIIDYDIHGLVGIRLINPSESDAKAVAMQLGPLRAPLQREPDITLRFVNDLPILDLHYLGLNKVGYDEESFYILRSGKKDVRVKISFEEIGGEVKMTCKSGLKSVPLLLAIINLTLLKKNIVALHASAFVYNDAGIIVTGWAKGGKTEALLSFAAQGAVYVGDEWIFLSADGENMYGIPENIRLWDWHLDNLPHVKSELSFEKKGLFKTIHFLDRFQQIVPRKGIGKSLPMKFLREAMPAFKRQLNVQIPPGVIFDKCSETFSARPEKIFLLLSHEGSDYSVRPIEPLEIVHQMIASIQFEFIPFMESYFAYKFAFPDKANVFIEQAHKLQHNILTSALKDKEAFAVRHPYPLSFEKLFEVMRPYCETKPDGNSSQSHEKLAVESEVLVK